ncbi:MAG TPA: hypothetical protein VFG12_00180 [Rhodopila sp.]|jgi:hypothetical protein|nr:hypothetical protein [Rhodopila sp.]
MLYETVDARHAARAPGTQGILGYWYNHGGLNNQKMALIGLILSGIRDRMPINLPYIYNKDLRTEAEHLVRVEDVFDLDAIRDFASRHGVTVHAECPCGERGGWDYFRAFNDFFATAGDRDSLQTALGAVLCLKPRIALHPAFLTLRNFVFNALGIDTVVQLRIETDWRHHVATRLRPIVGDSEDNDIGFQQILAKVRNTFPDVKMLYVTADEQDLPAPRQEIRDAGRSLFGIELLWKTDLLDPAMVNQLTPLDLSLIDFEIARCSRRFVGLSRSTFAGMLAIEQFAATGRSVTGHYIYNRPGDVVVQRQDNGFTSASQRALSPFAPARLLADRDSA